MNAEVILEVDADLRPILDLCDGEVSRRTDGWRKLIHMERLRFYVGASEHTMDALLCLNHDNPNYPTKLYLPEKVGGNLNWNEAAQILGRHWVTYSWSNVSPNQTPFEILAAHLSALAKA